jgi:hypothetical protein
LSLRKRPSCRSPSTMAPGRGRRRAEPESDGQGWASASILSTHDTPCSVSQHAGQRATPLPRFAGG